MIKALIVLVILFVVATVGLNAYLTPDDLSTCGDTPSSDAKCQKVDAIVAVSGGSTSIRTAEAIDLYKNGWADYLIFSGAAKDTSGPSNALVMKRQAVEAGVPTEAIIMDDTSQTTHENAEKTATLVEGYDINRIILVTSPYHQRRASLEFHAILGDTVSISNHPARSDSDWPWYWWTTPRGWWLAIGEAAKIIVTHAGESK